MLSPMQIHHVMMATSNALLFITSMKGAYPIATYVIHMKIVSMDMMSLTAQEVYTNCMTNIRIILHFYRNRCSYLYKNVLAISISTAGS